MSDPLASRTERWCRRFLLALVCAALGCISGPAAGSLDPYSMSLWDQVDDEIRDGDLRHGFEQDARDLAGALEQYRTEVEGSLEASEALELRESDPSRAQAVLDELEAKHVALSDRFTSVRVGMRSQLTEEQWSRIVPVGSGGALGARDTPATAMLATLAGAHAPVDFEGPTDLDARYRHAVEAARSVIPDEVRAYNATAALERSQAALATALDEARVLRSRLREIDLRYEATSGDYLAALGALRDAQARAGQAQILLRGDLASRFEAEEWTRFLAAIAPGSDLPGD